MKVRQLIGFSFIVFALVIVYFSNSVGEYRQPKHMVYQYNRGASELVDSQKGDLINFVSPYIGDPRFRFVIKAHTGADGSQNANQELSEKRAQSVKEFLQTLGINENRFVLVKGVGQTEPLPQNNLSQYEWNRANSRVDISLFFQE